MIESGEHLRPWILEWVGHPLEQPAAGNVSFLIPVAKVVDEFEQQIALSLLRLHGPAAPGIEAHAGIDASRVESDLVDVIGAPVDPDRVALNLVPSLARWQHGAHLFPVDHLHGPGVEQEFSRAVVQGTKTLHGIVKRHDGHRPPSLPPIPRIAQPRLGATPACFLKGRFDLLFDGIHAGAGEVCEIVEIGLTIAPFREFWDDEGPGSSSRHGPCGGDTRIFGVLVVVVRAGGSLSDSGCSAAKKRISTKIDENPR